MTRRNAESRNLQEFRGVCPHRFFAHAIERFFANAKRVANSSCGSTILHTTLGIAVGSSFAGTVGRRSTLQAAH